MEIASVLHLTSNLLVQHHCQVNLYKSRWQFNLHSRSLHCAKQIRANLTSRPLESPPSEKEFQRARPIIKMCGITSAKDAPSEKEFQRARPIIKMCGITSAKDAALAAQSGASLIGMVLWPKSKRSVSISTAKEISQAARNHGADPVGVFVDDDLDTMLRASEAANLEFLQLHGDGSRAALPQLLRSNRVIYVLHADGNGKLLNHVYTGYTSFIDWILVDSANGGSGKGFNWQKFQVPSIRSKHGWLLAGGLHPENVCEAIATLRPDGVDVSSGICGANGIQKDPLRISSFVSKVNSAGHY